MIAAKWAARLFCEPVAFPLSFFPKRNRGPRFRSIPPRPLSLRLPVRPRNVPHERLPVEIEQTQWTNRTGWLPSPPGKLGGSANLALVFSSSSLVGNPARSAEILSAFPRAIVLGCSTAGEICGTRVSDDSIVVSAVRFDRSSVGGSIVRFAAGEPSFQVGKRLAAELDHSRLRHVFVLSNGLGVNGSDLVRGLASRLPADVAVTGGLAGDGGRFRHAPILWGGSAESNAVAAIGFYGSGLRIGFGSMGGWDPFGPERLVTRSQGNELFEFDGKSALALYKKYLGDHAAGLPATGLFFPLSIRAPGCESSLVRTLLAVDETRQSMTFAGDVPEGSLARLMKANSDRLIDGAVGAAKLGTNAIAPATPQLAILISCVGRKMVLRQRAEEEIEGVREVLGPDAVLSGFYSYGEIAPQFPSSRGELHNQTMTVTLLSES